MSIQLADLKVRDKLCHYHDNGTPSPSLIYSEVIEIGLTNVKVRDEFGNEAWKNPSFFNDRVVPEAVFIEVMREKAHYRSNDFQAYAKPARLFDFTAKDFGPECDRSLEFFMEVLKAYKARRAVPCNFLNGMYVYNNAFAYALATMYHEFATFIPVAAH